MLFSIHTIVLLEFIDVIIIPDSVVFSLLLLLPIFGFSIFYTFGKKCVFELLGMYSFCEILHGFEV